MIKFNRGVPSIFRFAVFLLLFAMSNQLHSASNDRLVMVISNQASLTALSNKELRRIYLGLTVKKSGEIITPVRNHTHDDLHEVFLQKVMFMSSRTYERQLNLRTIKKGIKPPTQFEKEEDILQYLENNPNMVSYMWESKAKDYSNLRVLDIN